MVPRVEVLPAAPQQEPAEAVAPAVPERALPEAVAQEAGHQQLEWFSCAVFPPALSGPLCPEIPLPGQGRVRAAHQMCSYPAPLLLFRMTAAKNMHKPGIPTGRAGDKV